MTGTGDPGDGHPGAPGPSPEPSPLPGTTPPGGPRRPAAVYGVGTDPDPRFSLANERTALAWLRTALALVAGGVALTSLATAADLPALLDAVAALLCALGGATAVSALLGWRAAERAMRLGRPLPAPRTLPLLVGGVVLVAAVLAGYAVAELA